jgi:riboflavin kinase/FMN adenylyltransferase
MDKRMKIIYSGDKTSSFMPCVATVGIFDGVHAGHRFLIEELKSLARERQLESVVITFAEHPRTVLSPEFKPQILDTLTEKIAHIESTGVDTCIVLNFTTEMAKLSASDFIVGILYQQFNVRTLLVGHDHRFGHNRADGFEEYKKYGNSTGMEVFQAARYTTDIDAEVNSSEVRKALNQGDIEKSNRLLSYPYSISGSVVEGFKVGRTIGFPTANIEPNHPNKLIPSIGVYDVRVLVNNRQYLGMLNIGNRPTLNNGEKISIEVHILNFNEDIYNQTITVSFLRKIRDQRKFNGIDELKAQLQKDKNYVIEMNK